MKIHNLKGIGKACSEYVKDIIQDNCTIAINWRKYYKRSC